MSAPQIIYIIICAIELLIYAAKHGQYRDDKYNIGVKILDVGILTGLLIWGGWFAS